MNETVHLTKRRAINLKHPSLNTLFVIGNIFPRNGGVTHAVYARANALAEESSRTVIATVGYDPNFSENVRYHKAVGNIHPQVEVVSQYEQWQGQAVRPRVAERNPLWSYFHDSRRANAYRVFNEDGEYIRYEAYRDSGVVEFIDHFAPPWTRVRKAVFDSRGVPRKDLYMSHSENRPEFQVLRDNLGRPRVSSKLDASGRPITYLSHFDEVEYRSEVEMAVPWLQSIVDEMREAVLFIDKREFVRPLAALSGLQLKRVFVMHSSHLDRPFTDPKKFSPSVSDAFDELAGGRIDRMVFLTKHQAEDAAEVVGFQNRFSVIPHYVVPPGPIVEQREGDLLVTVARYHPAKNLGAALKIFARVLNVLPSARYEIYGYGPELRALEELATDLEIADRVSFEGFTDTPADIFSRASVSLLTSRYEGFGLVLLESLSAGTPVVSFDTRYGPRDIVRDGVDGFVVPYGDEGLDAAADAVIRLLEDRALNARMGAAGRDVVDRFSMENSAAAWRDLLASL